MTYYSLLLKILWYKSRILTAMFLTMAIIFFITYTTPNPGEDSNTDETDKDFLWKTLIVFAVPTCCLFGYVAIWPGTPLVYHVFDLHIAISNHLSEKDAFHNTGRIVVVILLLLIQIILQVPTLCKLDTSKFLHQIFTSSAVIEVKYLWLLIVVLGTSITGLFILKLIYLICGHYPFVALEFSMMFFCTLYLLRYV